jgi:hypothetical protein
MNPKITIPIILQTKDLTQARVCVSNAMSFPSTCNLIIL